MKIPIYFLYPDNNLYIKMFLNKKMFCLCFSNNVKNIFSNRVIHTGINTRKVEELPSTMMNSWQIDTYGSLDNMKLSSIPIPEINKPSDVLVKVTASSINQIDLYMIEGFGNNLLSKMRQIDELKQGNCSIKSSNFPLTLGRDFSGKVVATGENVKVVAVGDTVCGVVDVQNQGCHSQYAITSQNNVCNISSEVCELEAASLPFVGLTCWNAVVTNGGIRPDEAYGKRVLILGASGGLGSLATQMLSSWGVEVVGVCSESDFEFVTSLGSSEVYDYRSNTTFSDILSDQRGFDLLLDASGTADDKWMQTLKRHSGASFISLRSCVPENIEENGFIIGLSQSIASIVKTNLCNLSDGRFYKWGNFTPDQSALEYLSRMLSQGKLRPTVTNVFPFENAPDAYKCLSQGNVRGKLVLDFREIEVNN